MEIRNRFELLREEELGNEGGCSDVQLQKKNIILEKTYNMAAEKVLGYKKKKVKPWISRESWDLIEQKKAIKLKLDGTTTERLKEKRRADHKPKTERWRGKYAGLRGTGETK